MEKPSTIRHNGVLRLPPGFRFHPTDEELVVQYLTRKVFAYPLPASIIPDINLGSYNPWDLPGGGGSGEDRYFFNLREAKYPTGNRSNRATGSGYWKATGKDKSIVASRCNQVVGMKKVLVFYQGKPPNGPRTDWIMHEYRLAGAFPQRKNTTHNTDIPMKDWVLCRIFKKKRASKMECEEDEGNGGIRFIDFMGRSGDLSDSSCVTDISDESISGDETSNKSSP